MKEVTCFARQDLQKRLCCKVASIHLPEPELSRGPVATIIELLGGGTNILIE